MKDIIKKLNLLNENKDEIIKKIREIEIGDITTTQAQNLREYATHTESIEEILLYIEYQNAREKKFVKAGSSLIKLIKNYQSKDIDLIRYMLGSFARLVIIEDKKRKARKEDNHG